jgi:hypothetical protein
MAYPVCWVFGAAVKFADGEGTGGVGFGFRRRREGVEGWDLDSPRWMGRRRYSAEGGGHGIDLGERGWGGVQTPWAGEVA